MAMGLSSLRHGLESLRVDVALPWRSEPRTSIVKPRLQEIYSAFTDQVHDAVLLGQTPGPSPGGEMFERLRFAKTTKRISQNGFDQRQRTQGDPPIGLHPMAQIVAKLWMKDRLTLDRACCASST